MINKAITALRWAGNHPLKRGSKMNAIRSFISAQLGARLVEGDVCVALANQTRLLVPPRMKGAFHFIWPGIYDYEEMSFVMHYLRPGDLFVDAGANIGIYTVLASGVTGARSIAFEPDPQVFSVLKSNVALNNLSELASVRNAALGDRDGTIRFSTGLGTENHVVKAESENSIEITLSTLDKQLQGTNPSVVKIDVEGFEREVLLGGMDCLSRASVLIIERVGNAPGESELHDKIRSLGFVPCAYSPDARRLRQISNDSCGNVIYIRDLASAGSKLAQAPAYKFAGKTI